MKVHVWAGISCRGATGVCIFDGIMDAPMYTCILEDYLIPFIQDVYPKGHRFMQDNDLKHTSRHAQAFFSEKHINWWKIPPESPDVNPIENLWHELKVRTYVHMWVGVFTYVGGCIYTYVRMYVRIQRHL